MNLKILLSGDGGQGIQLMSDLVCRAAIQRGFFVSHIPNYGLEQRGGVSLAFIQISDSEIAYPKFSKPDITLILSHQAEERTAKFSITNSQFSVKDYEEILKKNNIPHQSYNMFFLGLLARMLGEKGVLQREKVFELLREKLEKKPNWEENKRAWELTKNIRY
ncbi:MAG: 2-oxoacid:acceptor oxidoreductase family protein [Candidatus Magasanikbacteria bacterium]|nr:2-oxoacid:acceptor oxidoreductase family protein [Candidatus Magasanikbacteria bacterium]